MAEVPWKQHLSWYIGGHCPGVAVADVDVMALDVELVSFLPGCVVVMEVEVETVALDVEV